MAEIAEAFRTGGVWMYLILAFGVLTPVWLIAHTLLNAFGRRLSAIAWWAGPIAVTVVACVGIGTSLTEGMAAMEHASSANRAKILAEALTISLNLAAFAGLLNAILGVFVAIGAGVSNLVAAPDETDTSWARSAIVGLVALAGAVGLGVAGSSTHAGAMPMGAAALLFFAGIGSALAVLPSVDEQAPGALVSRRITAAFGAVCTAVFATLAMAAIGGRMIFRALEHAELKNRPRLISKGMESVGEVVSVVGGIGGGLAVLLAAIVIGTAASRLTDRTVVRDAIACAVGLLLVAAASGYALAPVDDFSTAFDDEILRPDVGEETASVFPDASTDQPHKRQSEFTLLKPG